MWDVDLAELVTDPYSPELSSDATWVTPLCVMEHAAERLSGIRGTICGAAFFGLIQLRNAAEDKEVTAKLVMEILYFGYLVVREGFINRAPAKRSAWDAAMVAKNVQVIQEVVERWW